MINSGPGTLWIGLLLLGAGAAIVLVMIGIKVKRDLAKDAVEFADPKSPATLAAERLAAVQAQIERDRKPARHRNMEEQTHALVRQAVARKHEINGERNYRHEPHWYESRPNKQAGVW